MHTTDSSVSGVFRLRITGLPHIHGERPEVSPTVTSTAGSDRARRRRRERGEHANIRLVCLPCIALLCTVHESNSIHFAEVQHGGHSKGFFELHTTSPNHFCCGNRYDEKLSFWNPWSLSEFMSVTSVHIVTIGHRLFSMERKTWSALKCYFVSVSSNVQRPQS